MRVKFLFLLLLAAEISFGQIRSIKQIRQRYYSRDKLYDTVYVFQLIDTLCGLGPIAFKSKYFVKYRNKDKTDSLIVFITRNIRYGPIDAYREFLFDDNQNLIFYYGDNYPIDDDIREVGLYKLRLYWTSDGRLLRYQSTSGYYEGYDKLISDFSKLTKQERERILKEAAKVKQVAADLVDPVKRKDLLFSIEVY